MSTAVVSASTLYDFGDVLYKNKLPFKGANLEGKCVGMASPVGLSRRNSNPVGKYSAGGGAGGGNSDYNNSVLNANQLNNNNNNNNPVANANAVNNANSQHRKLDRSHSEPVERSSSQQQQQQQQHKSNINTSRYKTELCRPFEESGTCKYGDKCQFAHGGHELRTLVRHPKYKTELCRTFHTTGFCPYGPRCHFIHNADEARSKTGPPSPTSSQSSNSSQSQPIRPKPLTFEGSAFSLGSTADSPSPPSSLSESPTSMGSFFTEELFMPFSPPAAPAPTPTTSFPFMQNNFMTEQTASAVAAAVVAAAMHINREPSPPLMEMRRHSGNQAASSVSSASLDSVASDLDLEMDLEALSMGPATASSPTGSVEILSGPMAVSRSLRLPVFNNLSRQSTSDDM